MKCLTWFNLSSTFYTNAASETSAPQIKLEPARSTLHPHDSIVVNCQSSAQDSPVVWKREGNRRLPSNFHVSHLLVDFNTFSLTSMIHVCFSIFCIQKCSACSNKVINCTSLTLRAVMQAAIFVCAKHQTANSSSPSMC